MPLWFEIAVLVLLAAIVLQLYGIEGNIGGVEAAIRDYGKSPRGPRNIEY